MLEHDTCYHAMRTRDSAFDGVFFVGVKTTGIYCRPVCRARMPLQRNVCFFVSAAAAEHAGFRPCLRCRPETAPFCPAWKGTRTTVERALRMIDAGELDRLKMSAFAERLGVGSRHLVRLFTEHLGASPTQVARTRRIQRAKRMLDETVLPITEIAAHAGFTNARRMAAIFLAQYGRTPSALRKHRRRPQQPTDSTRPQTA